MLPVELSQTLDGAVIDGVVGVGLTVTARLFEAEQPAALASVTVNVVVPEEPAVYVIVWMFVALVIVPLVIVQAYVAPPTGSDAWLPVESAQTEALTVTVAPPEPEAVISGCGPVSVPPKTTE